MMVTYRSHYCIAAEGDRTENMNGTELTEWLLKLITRKYVTFFYHKTILQVSLCHDEILYRL